MFCKKPPDLLKCVNSPWLFGEILEINLISRNIGGSSLSVFFPISLGISQKFKPCILNMHELFLFLLLYIIKEYPNL